MNFKPLAWIGSKYFQELIDKEVIPIKEIASNLEKENISLNHSISNHKERIVKLEDRLREYEIKIASFTTAIEVVRQVNFNSIANNKNIDNEQ